MDGQSFDRIARLLGGAATRRAGIKAAVIAAVGLATRGALPEEPAGAEPGQEGPCLDRTGKNNRCKADGDCCTKYCKKGKAGKTGRCRCIRRGKPCRPDQTCCRGTCTNGKCPKKKRCVPPGGSCKTRTKKKKNGKKKRIRRGCCTGACMNGRCAVPTGQPCPGGPGVCVDPAASCATYNAIGAPLGTYCLLPDSQPCTSGAQCVINSCYGGVCAASPGTPAGEQCSADDDCASGLCAITNGNGRCITPRTFWAKLSWSAIASDLDSQVWMPQAAPQESQAGNGEAFPNGGDFVWYETSYYPWGDGSDPDTATPPFVPDVWLDVDDTATPGAERTIWFRTLSNASYRFSVRNYSLCQVDSYASACKSGWSGIDLSYSPFTAPTYQAKVEFFEGSTLLRTFDIPSTVAASGNVSHYYIWQVTDILTDANGYFKAFSAPAGSGGTMRNCEPVPYPANPIQDGYIWNFCPLT